MSPVPSARAPRRVIPPRTRPSRSGSSPPPTAPNEGMPAVFRYTVFGLVVLATLVALGSWLVRTRRGSPFGLFGRTLRSVAAPTIRPADPPSRAAAGRIRSQPARRDVCPEHSAANPTLVAEARMKLLKALVSFIVGTIAGAIGSKLFGPFGAILGFIAGGVAAWWVAQRMALFE